MLFVEWHHIASYNTINAKETGFSVLNRFLIKKKEKEKGLHQITQVLMILSPVSVPGATSGWLEGETFRGSGAKGLCAGDILLKAISIHAKRPFLSEGQENVTPAVMLMLGMHCHLNLYL